MNWELQKEVEAHTKELYGKENVSKYLCQLAIKDMAKPKKEKK